jgi:CheY-like chemotaxis protein
MPALRVLMIDDSSLALEVQVMMFERRGYEVCGCLDLTEMKDAAAFAPDVVVTDVGLADATIDEACRAIRDVFGADVPLLLFSGQEDHELEALVQRLAPDAGVCGFINKADSRNVVYEKIESAAKSR